MSSKKISIKSLVQQRRIYSVRTDLPPGSVPVECRHLAKYTPPGSTPLPHGVPPIAKIILPSGTIDDELYCDDEESMRVLPFRFPWESRAHGLMCGKRLVPVIRTIMPFEMKNGEFVVVKLNENHNWRAFVGFVRKAHAYDFFILRPDGNETHVNNLDVSFVGKVMCWWDDR